MVQSIKPVMLTGSQGSWKSFTAASIALCRVYLLDYKLASIVDPHFRKNKTKPWKHLIQHEPLVYGDLINDQDNDQEIWLDINNGINDCLRRWIVDKEDSPFKVSIFDELTGYSRREECKTSAPKLMSSVIADPRKANEGVILITHSLTSSGTGGSEGFSEAIKEGCLHLELKSDNFAKPLYRGILNGYKDEKGDLIKEKEVTIPHEWFNPDSIREMFKNG